MHKFVPEVEGGGGVGRSVNALLATFYENETCKKAKEKQSTCFTFVVGM